MARELAPSTLERLRRKLEEEQVRLETIIDEHERERENARDLLERVKHAQDRMDKGQYGICEVTGEPIPVARLEALPYATTTVEAANRI